MEIDTVKSIYSSSSATTSASASSSSNDADDNIYASSASVSAIASPGAGASASGMEQEEERMKENQGIWKLKVKTSLPNAIEVPVNPDEDTLETVADFIKDVLSYDLIKFVYKGKMLKVNDENENETIKQLGIENGATLKLMGSKSSSVEKIKNTKSDPTIRSFAEEQAKYQRLKQKENYEEHQDSTYKFCKFQVYEHFTDPHPYEAERLLRRLACDPGIVHIMKKHKFVVGYLREMSPDEAYAKKKEAEGGCLLGYNENAGASISLRLRMDDDVESRFSDQYGKKKSKEFRGYKGLINTLLHELSHNMYGPHNEDFWRLFAQLKSEYLEFHAVEARAGKLVEGKTSASKYGMDTSTLQDVKTSVSNHLRNEIGNGALSEHERSSVAKVVSEMSQVERQSTFAPSMRPTPPAAGSVMREEMRQKQAKAAEERLKRSQASKQQSNDAGGKKN